jgi:hypothetical protein
MNMKMTMMTHLKIADEGPATIASSGQRKPNSF